MNSMAEEAVSGANAVPSSSQQASPGPIGSSVIPIANKLQHIFAQLGSSSTIDLPQVAVEGNQSSGKSSVLEALVGRDFLQRGSHICTRRPLVLQLVHFPSRLDASAGEKEWGEFLNIPGKRFYDFREIRREIQAETDREAEGNKRVSDKQIRLKIFSPNVLNITLINLPGITKIPVGNQPSDIAARIRAMILSYIKHETCIILAVSPGNADLSNSNALQIARIADPNGSRTIGVIIKLDIIDRGTDARNFLLGNVIPLRLGYVGVVNGSQQDGLDGNKFQVSEKSQKSRAILARAGANGVLHDQALGVQPHSDSDRLGSAGNPLRKKYMNLSIPDKLGSAGCSSGSGNIGGILSIFGVSKSCAPAKEISSNKLATVPSHSVEHSLSMIQPQEEINLNRNINDALSNEEAFFRHHPVYHDISHCCGVPKLAKKLNQNLVQHIRSVLTELKSRINSQLVVVGKEHAAYGDVVESKESHMRREQARALQKLY